MSVFNIKCPNCGCANQLKIGRIYNALTCAQCHASIDTDASATLDLLMKPKPVTLRRDTVTVGFRSREDGDAIQCVKCGAPADLASEDVLEVGKQYKCGKCGCLVTVKPGPGQSSGETICSCKT